LLNPQESDAVSAIVECEFDIILDADIRFDSNLACGETMDL
jgi:hypothetical protein